MSWVFSCDLLSCNSSWEAIPAVCYVIADSGVVGACFLDIFSPGIPGIGVSHPLSSQSADRLLIYDP